MQNTPQNYYELLQLSPHADQLVITKIYRLLAAYYHPDNKQTGDEEKFKNVLKAYEVLSDPAKRARYNIELLGSETPGKAQPRPEGPAGVARNREELKTKFGAEANGDKADESVSDRELRNLWEETQFELGRVRLFGGLLLSAYRHWVAAGG